MKKTLIGLLILGLLAGAVAGFVWLRGQQTPSSGPEVLRVGEVFQGDLEITVPASGSVAVSQKLDLYFSAPGTVAEVLAVRDGRVAAGEVLARLDTAALRRSARQSEIALEQARLDLLNLTQPTEESTVEMARLARQSAAQALEAARLGRQTAESDANALLVQAQRAREQAHRDYVAAEGTSAEERARTTYESALEQERVAQLNAQLTRQQAQNQWMAAYTGYQQADQGLNRLQKGPTAQQIRQLELQIELAELALEQAQQRLADAELRAPFAGVIAVLNLQAGMPAPNTTPAVTLVDDSAFYVNVTVDEIDIGKVAVGQPVSITLDAYPDQALAGEVEAIAPAAMNVGGIISYRLRLRFTDTGAVALREGMTVNIVIRTRTLPSVTLIPNWAIRTEQATGETYTYVVQGETVRWQTLAVGARNDNFTEVFSGVTVGETVAQVAEERARFFDAD